AARSCASTASTAARSPSWVTGGPADPRADSARPAPSAFRRPSWGSRAAHSRSAPGRDPVTDAVGRGTVVTRRRGGHRAEPGRQTDREPHAAPDPGAGAGGRRRDRAAADEPAAAARGGGPASRHHAAHQLPGRVGLGRAGHLRHHADDRRRRRHGRDRAGGEHGAVPALGRHAGQALRPAARADPHAPGLGGAAGVADRHRDPGGEPRARQQGDDRADGTAHRPGGRADPPRLRPRPLVHRRGGARLRVRRRDRRRPGRAAAGRTAPGGGARMSSYTIPSVVETTPTGQRAADVYSRLLSDRIVFLGTEIDDGVANTVIAQLIHLESADPDREIALYLNSPGGSVTASLAIYDTMQ